MRYSTLVLLNTLLVCSALGQNPIIQTAFPPDNTLPTGVSGYTLDTTLSNFDNSVWHVNWDEANVFKAQLNHQDYALRIGKGGQLYSIKSPIGELCPRQWQEHAWVDDTWLLTTHQYDLAVSGGGNEFTPFIHQCGVYPHIDAVFQQGNQFWAPIVAEEWDANESSFSTVSLGMISSGPSYNRADMLMYQKTRDLGDGAFEIVYMAYNYNTSYTEAEAIENFNTDFGPWGGTRPSILPYHIRSFTDGTWAPDSAQFPDYHNASSTAGWAVTTQDITDSLGYAVGYVYGKDKPSTTNWKAYSHGTTGTVRDFNVQAITYRQPFRPGKTMFARLFLVLGEFHDVVARCAELEPFIDAGFLNFPQQTATQIPIYLTQQNGQTVVSSDGVTPSFYVFSEPVENSKPLYLIRNNQTDQLHLTSDPYMTMPRYPIPSNIAYEGYRPYDGTTDILKLIGFGMPAQYADSNMNYVALNAKLTDVSFYPEDGLYDVDIMVLDANTVGINSEIKPLFNLRPNPANNQITVTSSSTIVSIVLYDSAGRVMLRNEGLNRKEQSISLEVLNSGVYFASISDKNGITVQKRLVKL